ncbi:hypothetical protein QBC35DRAFT_488573 [Podospora australis]|uniref:Uncharacterized protein n=1 Tax=Podospora australis TaxID=1536484 RepID=A0AAN6WZ73_9PEZI|nr:hypothetical protein QBC35DRAFT_488573 [Podospora australis]
MEQSQSPPPRWKDGGRASELPDFEDVEDEEDDGLLTRKPAPALERNPVHQFQYGPAKPIVPGQFTRPQPMPRTQVPIPQPISKPTSNQSGRTIQPDPRGGRLRRSFSSPPSADQIRQPAPTPQGHHKRIGEMNAVAQHHGVPAPGVQNVTVSPVNIRSIVPDTAPIAPVRHSSEPERPGLQAPGSRHQMSPRHGPVQSPQQAGNNVSSRPFGPPINTAIPSPRGGNGEEPQPRVHSSKSTVERLRDPSHRGHAVEQPPSKALQQHVPRLPKPSTTEAAGLKRTMRTHPEPLNPRPSASSKDSSSPNVSKRRVPDSRHPLVAENQVEHESSPSSPELKQQAAQASHMFATNITTAFNQSTKEQSSVRDRQREKYRTRIRHLQRELAKTSEAHKYHSSRSKAKTTEIRELLSLKEGMGERLAELETKLTTSNEQNTDLTNTVSALKEQLSSALQEQQGASREFEQRLEEVQRNSRTEFEAQKSRAENESKGQQEMMLKVQEKATRQIAHSEEKLANVQAEMNLLKEQVVEKTAKLETEKSKVHMLAQKVETLQTSSKSFDTLAAQNAEILRVLTKRESDATNRSQQHANEPRQRLDNIWGRLEETSKDLATKLQIPSYLQEAHSKELNRTTTKLDSTFKASNSATEATRELSSRLDTHIDRIRQTLDNKVEALDQQLVTKESENKILTSRYNEENANCRRLEQDLDALRKSSKMQLDRINELQENVIPLTASHERDQEEIRKLQANQHDTSVLRDELKIKTAVAADLEEKLRVRNENYSTQLQNLTAEIIKLNQPLQEKEQWARTAVSNATEIARREAKIEMERAAAESAKRLQEANAHAQEIAGELEGIKTKPQQGELHSGHDSETIRSRRADLEDARQSLGEINLHAKHDTETVDSLRAELVNEAARAVETTKNSNLLSGRVKKLESELESRALEFDLELEASKEKAKKLEDLDHMRRVMVRSPANDAEEPVPLSISQEKLRRREALQPKSIMKRVTRSASNLADPEPAAGLTTTPTTISSQASTRSSQEHTNKRKRPVSSRSERPKSRAVNIRTYGSQRTRSPDAILLWQEEVAEAEG